MRVPEIKSQQMLTLELIDHIWWLARCNWYHTNTTRQMVVEIYLGPNEWLMTLHLQDFVFGLDQ